MGLASGFETYLTAYCWYQKKGNQKWKTTGTKTAYELTLRYQRVRPKYGQSAPHLSSGRENKEIPSEAPNSSPSQERPFLFLFWGSNRTRDLDNSGFFYRYPIYGTLSPLLSTELVRWEWNAFLLNHDPRPEKESLK